MDKEEEGEAYGLRERNEMNHFLANCSSQSLCTNLITSKILISEALFFQLHQIGLSLDEFLLRSGVE
jgi:hypothetical protein